MKNLAILCFGIIFLLVCEPRVDSEDLAKAPGEVLAYVAVAQLIWQ